MFKFLFRNSLLLGVTWAVIIFILCATPGQYIPSSNWLELLSFDKWVHASIFFVLQFLFLLYAVKKQKPIYVSVIILLLCIAYGGSLEIMQAKFFSNRSADVLDFIANSFGCLVAFSLQRKIKAKWAVA